MAYRGAMPAHSTDHDPETPADPAAEAITRSLTAIRTRIRAAADSAGRDADKIRLLPVSKTVSEERLRHAVAAGCTELGENKVQEAARKAEALSDLSIRWSVIGHLQRNKAKDVAAFAHEFQALDSLRLAEALERRLEPLGRSLAVYVQVNTSGEDTKSGVAPEQTLELLQGLTAFEHLEVRGLMTIAEASDDEERVRACFRGLRELRDRARETEPSLIGPGQLSMGMSGDLETAIEEGSTCVRIGRALFGERPAQTGG